MSRKKTMVQEYENSELIRLNKYLSDAGICSRREADRLIEDGLVKVNGEAAQMGMKVSKSDTVEYKGQNIRTEEEFILLALNKPRGIECTTDVNNKDNIVDFVGYKKRIYPIGRLDKDSEGLILLTNNGAIVNKILKASAFHEKEYEVTVKNSIDEEFIKKMSSGVRIEKSEMHHGEKKMIFEAVTRRCFVKKTGDKSFRIIITQGLNRQIRRMCEVCGAKVVTLKRIRIMNIILGNLKSGQYREVSDGELKELLDSINGDRDGK